MKQETRDRIDALVAESATASRAEDFKIAAALRTEAAELCELEESHAEAAGHYLGAADACCRALIAGFEDQAEARACVKHAVEMVNGAANLIGKFPQLPDHLPATLAERRQSVLYWLEKTKEVTPPVADGK